MTPNGHVHGKLDSLHEFDVLRYTLDATLPMNNDSMYGRVLIEAFPRVEGLNQVVLHARSLAVDSARCNGLPAGISFTGDSLVIMAAGLVPGQLFQIEVFYRLRGAVTESYRWYPQGSGQPHTISYADYPTRGWMPCFDEPWDKPDSGCLYRIAAPDSYTVAANGTLLDTVREGGRLVWCWRERHGIPTQEMVFHCSKYSEIKDTAYTTNGDTVPLCHYVWPEDSAAASIPLARIPQMLECYCSRFGRYPFDKYGVAALYPYQYAGWSHAGMTSIHRETLTGNYWGTIAHELGHMWWGDCVTDATWAYAWLAEGGAGYAHVQYAEMLGTPPGQAMVSNFNAALSGNAELYPVHNPPPELWGDWSLVYCKGAWIWHMLRGVMGDPFYYEFLRAYRDSFAYGNVVSADFARLADRFYPDTLGWFFDQWLYRPGHPKYTLVSYYRIRPDSNGAVCWVRQQASVGDLFKMPLTLSCSTATGRRDTVIWDSTAWAGPFHFVEPGSVASLSLDSEAWVLKEAACAVPYLSSITPGPGQLTLRWQKFSADPATVAGYNVYRSQTWNGTYVRVNEVVCPDTEYVDAGLPGGVPKFYKISVVCAEDTCYESRLSNYKGGVPSGVSGEPGQEPEALDFALNLSGANPSQGTVRLRYRLPEAGRARLAVYNLSGQLVRVLVDGERQAGRHMAVWDGRDGCGRRVASGVYLANLEWNDRKISARLEQVR